MAGVLDKDSQPLKGKRLARHIAKVRAANRPPQAQLELLYRLVSRLFQPVVYGADNIPDRPCLFIGNHSLFALDTLVLWPVLQVELGIFARPMADKALFFSDLVGDHLLNNGLVMGHPEVCSALMEEGQHILLYPGGAHESVKPQRQRYTLQWRARHGFLRLAAKHGYTIVPVGMVGPDEFYNYLYDGEELPDTPLGKLLRVAGLLGPNTRRDLLPPLPLGALNSLFPKPQRCLIGFGEPLNLAPYAGKRQPGTEQLHMLREQVAGRIEAQISELLLKRESLRHEDSLLRRILCV